LIADFDGDGKADLFWRDGSGANAIWLGGDPSNAVFPPGVGIDWTPIAAGNYGGSTRAGILWMRNDGIVAQWLFSDAAGLSAPSVRFLTGIPPGWQAINP